MRFGASLAIAFDWFVPSSTKIDGRFARLLTSAALMNPNYQLIRHCPEAALAIQAFVPA